MKQTIHASVRPSRGDRGVADVRSQKKQKTGNPSHRAPAMSEIDELHRSMSGADQTSRERKVALPVRGESSAELVTLVDQFLSMLAHERASSPHTLRAYDRELRDFAAFLIKHYGDHLKMRDVEHQTIRAYLANLYTRGLSKASV
ncbi:MAG TPA: site-specific integrase, partial [Acidisarcina sp.]